MTTDNYDFLLGHPKKNELELLEHVTFDIDDSFMLDPIFFSLFGKLNFTFPFFCSEKREKKRKNGELIVRRTNQEEFTQEQHQLTTKLEIGQCVP